MFTVMFDGNMGSDLNHEMAGQMPLLKVSVAVYMGKDSAGESLSYWITCQFWKSWMIEKLPTQYGKGSRVVVSGQLKLNQYFSQKNNQWMIGMTVDVDSIVPSGFPEERQPAAGAPAGAPPSPFGRPAPQGPPPPIPGAAPSPAQASLPPIQRSFAPPPAQSASPPATAGVSDDDDPDQTFL